jgi:hypothetical protein
MQSFYYLLLVSETFDSTTQLAVGNSSLSPRQLLTIYLYVTINDQVVLTHNAVAASGDQYDISNDKRNIKYPPLPLKASLSFDI